VATIPAAVSICLEPNIVTFFVLAVKDMCVRLAWVHDEARSTESVRRPSRSVVRLSVYASARINQRQIRR
jgi:hypothetical protein